MSKFVNGDVNQKFTSYIKNNITGTKIGFPVTPTNVTEGVSASFTQQDIVGASIPRIVYSNTSAQTLSISLQNLTQDYVQEGFDSLLHYVRCLQALAYPNYNAGIVKAPDLTLVLGNVSYSCVCTSVNVSWDPLIMNNGFKSCSVDLQLIVTRNTVPRSYSNRTTNYKYQLRKG